MSKFIVGEYIQRDGEILATVLTCEETSEINMNTIYRVEIEGALGYQRYAFATEHGWKPYVPHVHLTSHSRDCDGEYVSEFTAVPTEEERRNIFGDMEFKRRTISEAIGIFGFGGTLEIDGDNGFTWYEETEEGSIRVDGEWCYECSETNKASSFRDLAAEAAGY